MSRGYSAQSISTRLVEMEFDCVYRLVRRKYSRRPLGAVPTPSRFSDPDGQYAVLYAAASVRCSFWEALGRNRFMRRKRRELPRFEVEDRVIATLRSTEPLTLVDLRSDGPVRIGPPRLVHLPAPSHSSAVSTADQTGFSGLGPRPETPPPRI